MSEFKISSIKNLAEFIELLIDSIVTFINDSDLNAIKGNELFIYKTILNNILTNIHNNIFFSILNDIEDDAIARALIKNNVEDLAKQINNHADHFLTQTIH